MLLDCMSLFLVGVDRYLSAFLYSLTYFSLQIVSPSLGVLLLLKSEGGFLCPRVLTAWEIGVNEDRSLLVWMGISKVDDCVCLMLFPSCYWFSCTFIV